MRALLLPLLLLFTIQLCAQPELDCELNTLPPWMQALITNKKPVKCILPKRAPLYTNAFIGNWSVQKKGGDRFNFWSDKQRVVIQEFNKKGRRNRMYFIDLLANVRLNANISDEGTYFYVEDLYIEQAGYFHELWNDSVHATSRVEQLLATDCHELLGTDGNKDTTYYWSTDLHPDLFADLSVWGPWLCRQQDLKYLSALSDRNAGGSLRVDWPKRRFGPEAGSIAFLSITPGATPIPTLERTRNQVSEHRFQWLNNSGIGRLPTWMRGYVSRLAPHPLPAEYTPKPVARDIPDNQFIGTITAETPTQHIGAPDRNGLRDTTVTVAKYSYWADARRAVLQLSDPDDEGNVFYAVDLDSDVVMAAHNEGHSYDIPKLYIATLEEAGFKEFGRGLELDFTPRGNYGTILGHTCELHTTSQHFLSHFMFPQHALTNPVFDMKNWTTQRIGQKFKDLMVFGVADKPMPMSVMGTYLTSYKPARAKPPTTDLSNYRVKDERLERRPQRDQIEPVQIEEIRMGGSGDGMGVVTQEEGYDVEVPPVEMMVEERTDPGNHMPVREGRYEDVVQEEPEPIVVEQASVADPKPPDAPSSPPAVLSSFLANVLDRSTNRFIGTATLLFRRNYEGKTTNWTVKYASTAERSVLISTSDEPLPSVRTQALITHRKLGDEVTYQLLPDSTVKLFPRKLRAAFDSPTEQVLVDSANGSTRTYLDRTCEHRVHQSKLFRRDAWVDPGTPSIFLDLYSARKGWDGIDYLLFGYHLGIAPQGMPFVEDLFVGDHDHVSMSVTDLKQGPVDPQIFTITKASWKR